MKTMQIDIITFIWRWISPLLFSWSVMSWLFSDSKDYSPPDSSVHGISQARINGVGCHFLLQGVFWIQGSNPCLLHCRRSLYHWTTREARVNVIFKIKMKLRVDHLPDIIPSVSSRVRISLQTEFPVPLEPVPLSSPSWPLLLLL